MSALFALAAMPTPSRTSERRPAPKPIKPGVAAAALGAACGTIAGVMGAIRARFPLWRALARTYSPALEPLAAAYAGLACRWAQSATPAYAHFLGGRRFASLKAFPPTTKANYVRAYDHAARCRGGRIAHLGAMADESSGATGAPFNWLRSARELDDIHAVLANYIRFEFPAGNLFCINAFSMGAWATGVNFTMAMRKTGLVKSVGPDVASVIATLETFGPGFDYLVTAYPPFLKQLSDELDARGVPAGAYSLYGLVAGEAMTEALRAHLALRFLKVRSGYGASDVQVGVGGETAFTVWLRQALAADADLRAALLGEGEDRAPMIFQYNPFEIFIENSASGELLFTAASPSVLCPKLRYNLGDEGFVRSYPSVVRLLKRHIGARALRRAQALRGAIRLPLLFLYGRSDSTVSVMGANIYPQDVEHGLYADAEDARRIARFALAVEENSGLDVAPVVHVELRAAAEESEARAFAARLAARVVAHLRSANRDYANALKEHERAARIQVRAHNPDCGPFAAAGGSKIKHSYVLKAAAAP